MSKRNVESIHGLYTHAPKTMQRFAPSDLQVSRVGHFGFFRREMEDALWRTHLIPELAQSEATASRRADVDAERRYTIGASSETSDFA
jgi:hypothetical protein